jgi:tetratricopeptide (TPR) repeat protein
MLKWQYSLCALACLVILSLIILAGFRSRETVVPTVGPNFVNESIAKAEALNEKAKYADSLELLFKAKQIDPKNSVLKSLLERTFMLHVQSEIVNGNERIGRDKHDVGGYLAISRAFYLMNEPLRAMEALTLGVGENPKAIVLWLNIGTMELAQKRDAEAVSVFKEIIRLDEKNAIALNNIAFVESTSKDKRLINMQEAFAYSQKSVDIDPKNANYLETLAQIRFKRGEKDEAKRLILEAIRLDPEEPLYKAELAIFEKTQR